MRRDLGDFQTPPALVAAVLDALGPIGGRWPRVLEPSCGRGHFLDGLLARDDPPREIQAIEIQEAHADAARRVVAEHHARRSTPAAVMIRRASLFELDLRRDLAWRARGPLLVVGNPPWVTNAALGVLESDNLPRKWNVKGARGLDARTGAANFDIAEAVWLKLIDELAGDAESESESEPVTIALLCKMSVARNVLEHAERRALPIGSASLLRIDARRWFGAAVEACLFRLSLGCVGRPKRVPVFAGLGESAPVAEIGFARGRLVADLAGYERSAFADGACPLTWRQGLKHDAAAVMELTRDDATSVLRNGRGAAVVVEPEHVYPLLKGADMARPVARPGRSVIVTQTRVGQDTGPLAESAPRLWAYLSEHAPTFARRKSSIYRGQPPFAIFGIGPYSFAPFKVAVSGLHKTPRFHAIGPDAGRPVMLDDTGYFLACRGAEQAALVATILNDETTRAFLRCLIFPDAKRPITKAVLQRIDLRAIAARADRAALLARAEALRLQLLGADPETTAPFTWPATMESLLGEAAPAPVIGPLADAI